MVSQCRTEEAGKRKPPHHCPDRGDKFYREAHSGMSSFDVKEKQNESIHLFSMFIVITEC